MNKNKKDLISMLIETEEGKKLKEKIEIFKNDPIEIKSAFIERIYNNPELLDEGDNRLKFHCYIDDVIAYKFSKMK